MEGRQYNPDVLWGGTTMSKCVIVREDDPDLAVLVRELLEESGYTVIHVLDIDDLLAEAARHSPCVALVDGTSPAAFDLWWVGPRLARIGVPAVAFTAHASAKRDFEADNHDFVGVLSKPFDADEFVEIVNSICWAQHEERAAS